MAAANMLIEDIVKGLGKGFEQKEVTSLLQDSGYSFSKSMKSIKPGGKSIDEIVNHVRDLKSAVVNANVKIDGEINANSVKEALNANGIGGSGRLAELRKKYGRVDSSTIANGSRDTTRFDSFTDTELKQARRNQKAYNRSVQGTVGSENLNYDEMKKMRDLNSPDTWNSPNVVNAKGEMHSDQLPRQAVVGPSPLNAMRSEEYAVNDAGQESFNRGLREIRNSGAPTSKYGPYTPSKAERNLTDYSVFNDAQKMTEYINKNGIKNITNEQAVSNNILKDKISKKIKDGTAGAAAMEKDNAGKMDALLKKAVPIAVGGGLVFSMFGSRGQQSNAQLYGQQQAYGGGY